MKRTTFHPADLINYLMSLFETVKTNFTVTFVKCFNISLALFGSIDSKFPTNMEFILQQLSPFHATGLFLYPQKTSETQR